VSGGAASGPRAGRREWIGLGVIALPCLFYAMDLTVLNLALPRLSEALAPSSSQLLWIIDIYGFLVAGFLITMGNLGDRIGRRRLLLLGAGAFAVASLFAAFSTSAGMLIAARAVLGIAGATIAPSTLSLIRNMFLDPRQRTAAIGIWISSYSIGGAIGPVLGGVMLQYFWWGSVFLLGVPVMALLLALGPLLLPEFRDEHAGRLDLSSAALSLGAVLLVIFGVKRWAQDGLGWLPGVSIAAGLVLGRIFLRRQRGLPEPLLDPHLFGQPAFRALLATFTLSSLVLFGSYVFIGQYLQLVLGLSPLGAGLWLLPWSAGFVVGSLVAPSVARRFRPPSIMSVGLAVGVLGFALLAGTGRLGLPGLVTAMVVLSLGFAPVFTLGTDAIVGAAPPERAGAAAALSETSFELGGALGIAVLGSFGTAIYRGALGAAVLPGVPAAARRAALETLGGAAAVAATLPEGAGAGLLAAARRSFSHALVVTAGVSAAATVGTAVLALVVARRGRRR